MEAKASAILQSDKYNDETKEFAVSTPPQSNKKRLKLYHDN
ncbi:hypothetical protein [Photobacterium leiognathi]